MENSNSTEATKKRKPRTVSTARLEKIRLHKNLSVADFFDALKAVAQANPDMDFQEAITEYNNQNRLRAANGSNADPARELLRELFSDTSKIPQANGPIKLIRGRKGTENSYTVTIELGTGVTQMFWANIGNGEVEYGIQSVSLGTVEVDTSSLNAGATQATSANPQPTTEATTGQANTSADPLSGL